MDQRALGPPRLWPVFAAYVVAFASIVVLSLVAASTLRAMYPDVPDHALFTVLTALVGTVAGAGPNAALLAGCGCVFVGAVVWLRHCRTW